MIPRGRLSQTTQGSRTSTRSYDSSGFLSQVTDPLGRVTQFTRDTNGNVIAVTKPDGSVVQYGFDANSNLSKIKPPERSEHLFNFGVFDLLGLYSPPAIDSNSSFSSSYEYNKDKQLISELRPDGQRVDYNYEPIGGRFLGAQSGAIFEKIQYSPKGNIASLDSSDGVSIGLGYIGPIVSSKNYSGSVVASLTNSFSASGILLQSQSVNQSTVSFVYDRDNKVVNAGAMVISRTQLLAIL